jgi:MoxR-like ATPase
MLDSIEAVEQSFKEKRYICDRSLATVIYLATTLGKPLFLEGEAGVGKTEVAKVLAQVLNTRLIRLQCYEGLDANTSLYEWNYPKQILHIKLKESTDSSRREVEREIFSPEFLIERPLLEAIQDESSVAPVLLIDEIDRADEEFEAFLLEILSDFQITIPELGTVVARHRPYVVLTSNRTREIHDALKRRCLYYWIDYPLLEKEYEIIISKVPGINHVLAKQICAFMQEMRKRDFYKRPGIAESIDWAMALITLNKEELDEEAIKDTLGCIFKYREDITRIEMEIGGKKVDIREIFEEYLAFH